jgi:PAS domain S-box-containing protein
MINQTTDNKEETSKIKLPRLLKYYEREEYPEQIKARLIFYIYITTIVSIFLAIVVTLFNNISSGSILPAIYPRVLVEFVTLISLSLFFVGFIKGRYHFSGVAIITILQIQLWILMFIESADITTLYRIYVNILAVNAVIPIISKNESRTMAVSISANILLLYIITFHVHPGLFPSLSGQLLFLITTVSTMLFVAVIGINILKINALSLSYARDKLAKTMAMEEELKKSEKRYREMADLLPQSVFEVRSDGILTYINKNGLRMIGYTEEEVANNFNFINIIAPEDRELMLQNAGRFLTTGVNSSHIYMGIRKDGALFPVRFSSNRMYENGEVIGLRGIGIDITEQREAEEAMRNTLQLFRSIVEFAPLPIILFNDKDHILMINNAFKQVTDYTYADITKDDGIRVRSIIPDESYNTIKEILAEKGLVEDVEFKTKKRNQETIDIQFFCKQVQIKGKTVFLGIFIDVTQKKRNDLELEFYREDLERLVLERTEELAVSLDQLSTTNSTLEQQRLDLEKALEELSNTEKQLFLADKMASLGMLAAGIAHEINNPLNFIKGGIYGLESFFQDNLPEEKQQEALPLILAIDKGIDRAADIVKSLNRFNRETDNRKEECDLHSIIDDCLVLLDNQLKNRIVVTKHYNATQTVFLYNQGRINQAVLNLLANAAQAIEGQGNIEITTNNQNNSLFLHIKDDGCGIDEKYINHIFNPFFTTKEPGKGTGLGLSITFQIIKELDGEIEFSSAKGKGTTVVVRIPLIEGQNE